MRTAAIKMELQMVTIVTTTRINNVFSNARTKAGSWMRAAKLSSPMKLGAFPSPFQSNNDIWNTLSVG
ncbi:hypothetical protein HMPREF9337_00275 [Cutibacterium acnes HL096PA3]|nr:hypothetical protein HMPREF9337_00275 [Cutibacterium acnes HL096PA3]